MPLDNGIMASPSEVAMPISGDGAASSGLATRSVVNYRVDLVSDQLWLLAAVPARDQPICQALARAPDGATASCRQISGANAMLNYL
jgi:hypothetical protein